jgi:hypothetical protein
MTTITHDRRAALLKSTDLNGIDFVTITSADQTRLQVHFLNAVNVQGWVTGAITITGGETIATVRVLPLNDSDWGWDDGHVVLSLRVAAPGDFSDYLLTIPSPALDSFFASVRFSFKAGCPSDLDCQPPQPVCPPPEGEAPPIDYLAKDFLSFRQALLDFSALCYPAWQERSEADFGVMFLEALSAMADDLSYGQDRVAGEASLVTATQRRSVVRHARLVDYEPLPATGAVTRLQFDVASTVKEIPHGVAVIAPGPDGSRIVFETGLGLRDPSPPPPASWLWNRSPAIAAYWFDETVRCLLVGATGMDIAGHGYGVRAGQAVLIETPGLGPIDPPLRQIVTLAADGDEICDPLFPITVSGTGPPFMTCAASPPGTTAPAAVTRLSWRTTDALTEARDLSKTRLAGNICDASQGCSATESFVVGPPPPGIANAIPSALERVGPRPLLEVAQCGEPAVIRLHSLALGPLTWLPQPALDPSGLPVAEVLLSQTSSSGGPPIQWDFVRKLLTAGPFDNSFTVDPAMYRPIARNSDATVTYDYDSDLGDTIRFGDAVFGANPDTGTTFTVSYRYGAGVAGNVAAGTITQFAVPSPDYTAVMNPLAATGGADAQSLQSVRRLAPQDFRFRRRRAVLAQDYVAAAETEPWVKSAGSVFRWTGSWLTTFTTPEPKASEAVAIEDRTSLIDLLNRYRMAGTESYVPDPIYLSIDLRIEVCAEPWAFAAGVRQAIITALAPSGPTAADAFFAINRFVFGQPLDRSQLEAAIQAIPGVAGVTCIDYRLRDRFAGFLDMGDTVPVGSNEILRCDNDSSRPNNGALSVTVRGGR